MAYGAKLDLNSSSPALERVGDASTWPPGYAGVIPSSLVSPWKDISRCNVASSGYVSAYYGTPCYRDDEIGVARQGQAMVELPAFGNYVDTSDSDYVTFWVGQVDETITLNGGGTDTLTLHPLFIQDSVEKTESYVGAYEGYYNRTTGQLESKAGVQPSITTVDGIALATWRTLAQANRPSGWGIMTIQALAALQALYTVQYANFNAQAMVGAGVYAITPSLGPEPAAPPWNWVNYTGNTGHTQFLGNNSGAVTYIHEPTGTYADAVSLYGVENMWGNCEILIDGINIKYTDHNTYTPYITDHSFSFDTSAGIQPPYNSAGFNLPGHTHTDGADTGQSLYYDKMNFSQTGYEWLFLPDSSSTPLRVDSVDDQRTTYWCDTCSSYGTTTRPLVHGGGWSYYLAAGLFCYDWSGTFMSGARLQYIPQL